MATRSSTEKSKKSAVVRPKRALKEMIDRDSTTDDGPSDALRRNDRPSFTDTSRETEKANLYLSDNVRLRVSPKIGRKRSNLKTKSGVQRRKSIDRREFELWPSLCRDEPLPPLQEGQLLIKNLFISIDRYSTHKLRYADSLEDADQVIRAGTIGEILESRDVNFPVGTKVFAFSGVCSKYIGLAGENMLYAIDYPHHFFGENNSSKKAMLKHAAFVQSKIFNAEEESSSLEVSPEASDEKDPERCPERTPLVSGKNKKTKSLPLMERKPQIPLTAHLSVLSVTIGLTAWHGVNKILEPKPQEVCLISAASSPVGSLVAQLCKLRGAIVIGMADGAEKCRYCTEVLNLDGVVDVVLGGEESNNIDQALRSSGWKFDCYFDNVAGSFTDAVLKHMNVFGRIAVCGSVTEYQGWDKTGRQKLSDVNLITTMKNADLLMTKRLLIQGFICLDHVNDIKGPEWNEWQDCITELKDLLLRGKIVYQEEIFTGLEKFHQVVDRFLRGGNVGKVILEV